MVSSHGIPVTADAVAADVTLAAGDMVVLPGGLGGVAAIEGSQAAMDLICQAAADGSIWLCAICAAPNMLARHGLIDRGRRAVCYPGMEGALTEAGVAACMDQPVVVDGTLITGAPPGPVLTLPWRCSPPCGERRLRRMSRRPSTTRTYDPGERKQRLRRQRRPCPG